MSDDESNNTHLTNTMSRRITSLFARNSGGGGGGNDAPDRDFSTKNRSKEMKRLAVAMDVAVLDLREVLERQSLKFGTDNQHEKARYIRWLLKQDGNTNGNADSNGNSNTDIVTGKRDRSKSASNDDTKKTKTVRPKRPNAKATQIDDTMDVDDESETATSSTASTVRDPTLLSSDKFENIPQLSSNSKRALSQVLKLESMTEIQSQTFPIALAGTDILARARTGTGKTLAFLIPALERLLINENNIHEPGKNVGILVISPTRELAIQIGDQADKLLTYHRPRLSSQVMYGGTKMNRDLNALNKKIPSILIATPGRLLDHLENTRLANGRQFGYDVMRETPILVLDETDRLLDMGFRTDIAKIMKYLPKQEKRQTLLFSATVPKELKVIMAENMKSDSVEVDCIQDSQGAEGAHTNALVDQTYAVLPNLESQVTAVVQLVMDAMAKEPNHKIVVFFPTARMVGYFAEFFNIGLGIEVIELHSKKSQPYRNKASDKFRRAKTAVLFTSDVSARGVDYPDVTSVLQFGLPESREQYIHRLGRTGRAGKQGEGTIVLAPFEAKFIQELKHIDIRMNEDATRLLTSPLDDSTSKSVNAVLSRIRSGDAKLTISAQQCYQSFIGYYRGHLKRTDIRSKDGLVDAANTLARVMGLKEQPGLTKKAIGKMGLKGVKNLRIVSEAELRAKKRG